MSSYQAKKSIPNWVRLSPFSRVPRKDFVSKAVDIDQKTRGLEEDRLYSAKDILGNEEYESIKRQYGVVPEICIDYMIRKGYLALRRFEGHGDVRQKFYAVETQSDAYACDGIPDTALNRLLLDVE